MLTVYDGLSSLPLQQRTYHLEECQVRLFSVTGRTTSAPIEWCVILLLSPTVSLLFCIDISCHTQTVHRRVQRGGGQGVLTPLFPGPPPFHL